MDPEKVVSVVIFLNGTKNSCTVHKGVYFPFAKIQQRRQASWTEYTDMLYINADRGGVVSPNDYSTYLP